MCAYHLQAATYHLQHKQFPWTRRCEPIVIETVDIRRSTRSTSTLVPADVHFLSHTNQ